MGWGVKSVGECAPATPASSVPMIMRVLLE